jgi:Uma2 family endonuclease
MATQPQTNVTYDDLASFPEDHLRRELIGGELIVTAAPAVRHQEVVMEIAWTLVNYAKEHGGKVFPAPTDVFFSDVDVVEPDVLFVTEASLAKLETKFVRGAPDLVVEVSSPTTRRLELVRKRALYERYGVPEYWYVDLDADRIEVYRLDRDRYDMPIMLGRADALTSPGLPGLTIAVAEVLGAP